MLQYAVLYADLEGVLEGVLYAVLIGSSTALSINGFNMLFSPRNTVPFHSQYWECRPTARSQQKQQKNQLACKIRGIWKMLPMRLVSLPLFPRSQGRGF
jgi:hypothetical protein